MRQSKAAWFLAGSALVLIASGRESNADNVKLAFTSQVYWTPTPWAATAVNPAPPFNVAEADVVTGVIEFDPALPLDGNDFVGQPFSITIRGTGWRLRTQNVSGYVMDDRREIGLDCECPPHGPVSADDWILMSDYSTSPALPALDDRIELTRPIWYTPGVDAAVPWDKSWKWQPAITLIGDISTLDEDRYLPSDVQTWNAFSTKQLRIGVVQHGDAFRAFANITSFVEIPEPSGLVPAAMAVASWQWLRRRHGSMARQTRSAT
jgi:hypothetical protein